MALSITISEARGEATADPPQHRYDTGELGCRSGLPMEFFQVGPIPIGHEVLSVGTGANGSIFFVVKRGR